MASPESNFDYNVVVTLIRVEFQTKFGEHVNHETIYRCHYGL